MDYVDKFAKKVRCVYCCEAFSPTLVAKHLQSCSTGLESRILGRYQDIFLLEVRGKHFPEYVLFIEVNRNACTLKDIDKQLRDVWVECCGHLSSFKINNLTYESHPDPEYGPKEKSMQVKVNRIFNEGMIFEYTYDFGSSTELLIKVVSTNRLREENKDTHMDAGASRIAHVAARTVNEKRKIHPPQLSSPPLPLHHHQPVTIVARNEPIVFECDLCKKAVATNICTICLYEKSRKKASLCDSCVRHHECGEDMFLPIVNSPRSGECGYTGTE